MLTKQQKQRFTQWATSKGYTPLQISQEIARKEQELTRQNLSPANTSTPRQTSSPVQEPVSREPRTLGGLVKNVGQEAIDIGINSPISTARNIAGISYEAGRSKDIKSVNKRTDELLNITRQLKKEKDPVKKRKLIEQ